MTLTARTLQDQLIEYVQGDLNFTDTVRLYQRLFNTGNVVALDPELYEKAMLLIRTGYIRGVN